MKKIFRPLFAVMAIALVASCTEQIGNEATSEPGNLVKMTFSASMGENVEDTKTTYSGRKVYWEATDAITVFSVGETVTKSSFAEPELLENNAVARFSGVADASAETYYAVYPHSEANTYDDGAFSVTFPDTHTAVANGFPSGSNVSVAVSIKDAEVTEQNLQFKNVGALLSFSFNTAEDAANTKSVTFQARKSADDAQTSEFWGLTGNVTITIDENGLPIASEGSEDHVTVTAPVGGFEHGKAYFIPVCPVGDCTGMVVTFTDQNDDVYVKNNNSDFQLLRSYMFNVGKVLLPYDTLPKNIEVELNFVGEWPFEGDGPVADQVTWLNGDYAGQGDSYIYNHTLEDGTILPLEFKIARGRETSGDTGCYSWDAKDGFVGSVDAGGGSMNTMMCFPGIPNRYLTEVKVVMTNTPSSYASSFGLSTTGKFNSSSVGQKGDNIFYLWSDMITSNLTMTTISTANGKATLAASVYLRFRRQNIHVSTITLKYSVVKPGNAPTTAAE